MIVLEPSEGAAVWRRVHSRLLPPLFVVSLLCQLDRGNLAFAALQMDADLGFSRTIHGAGSGLFFIGYLAQIPANMVCVAVGPTRWLPTLLLCWGIVAMCFATVRSTGAFLALRLLLGIAEAGAYPAILYLLSLFYPPRSLGFAYACVATATAVAGLLGAPMAAALMLLDGVGGLRGWMWLFLAEGALPILLAAALPFLLPSSPLAARFLTPAQRQWLWQEVHEGGKDVELARLAPHTVAAAAQGTAGEPRGQECVAQAALAPLGGAAGQAEKGGGSTERAALLQPEQQHRQSSSSAAGAGSGQPQPDGGEEGRRWNRGLSRAVVRAGLLDRRVWHLACAMLLIDMCMNAANFWIPSLVRAALLGELRSDDDDDGDTGGAHPSGTALLVQASLLSALPFCGACIAMLVNAHHSRRTDERRLHTVVPMLVAAVGLAATPLVAGGAPAPALLALTLAVSGIWATHGPFFSWPYAFLDHKAAALGFALVKTGGAVGGFAGPFLVGALADALHGYFGAMLLLAGVASAAAALVYVFDDGS